MRLQQMIGLPIGTIERALKLKRKAARIDAQLRSVLGVREPRSHTAATKRKISASMRKSWEPEGNRRKSA